jgi:hypothetical protein
VPSKLCGALLGINDILRNGLVRLKDIHSFSKEALGKLCSTLLSGSNALRNYLISFLKGF